MRYAVVIEKAEHDYSAYALIFLAVSPPGQVCRRRNRPSGKLSSFISPACVRMAFELGRWAAQVAQRENDNA
jgi:hypothetical protein